MGDVEWVCGSGGGLVDIRVILEGDVSLELADDIDHIGFLEPEVSGTPTPREAWSWEK